jgi:hypothetical protein
LAIRGGPSPFFWVDVKPRKSSELSGMRSAPGPPAAPGAGEAAPREALANARHPEEAHRVGEQGVRRGADVVQRVATEQDGDVVVLEQGARRIAREALCVDEGANLAPGRG